MNARPRARLLGPAAGVCLAGLLGLLPCPSGVPRAAAGSARDGAQPIAATGGTYAVYGADTTQPQREAIARQTGVSPSAAVETVSTSEIVEALRGSGLPAAATDPSVASSVLTCLNRGDGLTVRTENITRITPMVYAGALLAAGAGDANVLIVAPDGNSVSGETALVGVLKNLVHCQGGKPIEAGRAKIAYQQVSWSLALAGPGGNLDRAADTLLKAELPVVSGQARDDAAISNALDAAGSATGQTVDAGIRPALIEFLRAFEHLDFGEYTLGYAAQAATTTQATLVPTAKETTLTGTLQNAGPILTVRVNGQDRQIAAAPNAVVTRNGRQGSLGALRPGDRVTVAATDGQAQRIDATAAAGRHDEHLEWAIPLAALLIVLMAVPFLISRVREDDFILEPNATAPEHSSRPLAEDNGLPGK